MLRRLRRICRHYGSDPVFLCSSATIQNPRELAERLTERPFELVDQSGAPRGEKFFVFVNPPVVNQQLGIRRSYLAETRRVASEFLKRNLQLIVFAQSRLATEILTTYLKDDFEGIPGAPEQIRGYRGGYLPLRRREIEKGLREGAVRAVVSTNALELGIDIGALDVSVMAGYPGTIAATWQRAGRAGRRSGRSAAVMVASSAPLDQFVVRNPSYFFDASPERALIDPDNLHILVDHIKCAAFELPFTPGETLRPPRRAGDPRHPCRAGAGAPRGRGVAVDLDERVLSGRRGQPALGVLRQLRGRRHDARDADHRRDRFHERTVARFTRKRSTSSKGTLYQVEKLDFEGRKAYVREIDCDYYTTAITYTKVTPIDTFAAELPRTHGEVHVVSRVVGFKKIKFYTNENVGSGELDLPEQQMHTTSYWLTIPAERDGGAAVRVRRSARRRRRPGVRAEAGRAAAADVRRPRHRHLDQQRGDRRHRRDQPAAHLRLRQLSRRDRVQRAVVPAARRAARGDAAADRRVPVRERLPGVRRADRPHRSAREGRGAQDSRSAATSRRARPHRLGEDEEVVPF